MPRTMLTDQHLSKLETIFRNFRIYLKQNLRNLLKLFFIEFVQAAHGGIYPQPLENQILYSRNFPDGRKTINY